MDEFRQAWSRFLTPCIFSPTVYTSKETRSLINSLLWRQQTTTDTQTDWHYEDEVPSRKGDSQEIPTLSELCIQSISTKNLYLHKGLLRVSVKGKELWSVDPKLHVTGNFEVGLVVASFSQKFSFPELVLLFLVDFRLLRCRLVNLTLLNLSAVGIQDKDIKRLVTLKKLLALDLSSNAGITDQFVSSMEQFPLLKWINLTGTRCTDVGLCTLAKFAHLKHITASDDIYNVIVSTDYNVIFNSDPNTKATIPQLKVKLQKLQVTPAGNTKQELLDQYKSVITRRRSQYHLSQKINNIWSWNNIKTTSCLARVGNNANLPECRCKICIENNFEAKVHTDTPIQVQNAPPAEEPPLAQKIHSPPELPPQHSTYTAEEPPVTEIPMTTVILPELPVTQEIFPTNEDRNLSPLNPRKRRREGTENNEQNKKTKITDYFLGRK